MLVLSIWVLLYGLGFYMTEKLSDALEIHHIITIFFLLFYTMIFIYYSSKHDKLKSYGICIPGNIRQILPFFMILLIAPISNLYFSAHFLFEMQIHWYFVIDALVTLFAAFFEELLFRGILPLLIEKESGTSIKYSTVISNIAFAMLHTKISYTSIFDLLIHIFIAFSIGLYFSSIKTITHSIFPAFILHFLINISYIGCENVYSFSIHGLIWIAIANFCLIYGIYFLKEE